MQKVFVLGLDGAVLDFIDRPELPNFQKVLQSSAYGTSFSRPALTPAAWTSMTTGVNPGKHGIFDFRVGERLLFATDKKALAIWENVPSVVINVPMTYPAQKIDGVMISGMMSPDLDSEMVRPDSERDYLKKLDYVIEADHSMEAIINSIEKRIKMTKRYWEYQWRLFFVVFREFDVLHHFFWGEDLPVYQIMDKFLGEFLLPRLDEQKIGLAIVSDHGFAPVSKAINIERLLEELGYDKHYSVGGWGALYQNPWSQISSSKREEIIYKIRNYKIKNSPILDVYKNEEIYHGPEAPNGPDLLVWPKRELGYTFKMRSDKVITNSTPKNGCHLEKGLAVFYNFGVEPRDDLAIDIKDIAPTLLTALNQPLPENLDGKTIF